MIDIPRIGFGTFPLRGEEGAEAVRSAVMTGYRLIDSAFNYDNEAAVAEGIRRSGIPREELFVASKLPGRFHERPLADQAIRESLWRMDLDYLDLYLIHWPNPKRNFYVEAWQALIDAKQAGLIKHIGVSNFKPSHLETLGVETGVLPEVNQVELHPYFPQRELLQVHQELGIQTESWSPLGKGNPAFGEPAVIDAAQAHGVTPGQAVLRWHIDRGSIPIPKSIDPSRQAENLDVFGFSLTPAEVEAITALGREDGRLFDGDPDIHEEL